MPVFLNGPSYIPPAVGINYSSWFTVAFIFRGCSLFLSRRGTVNIDLTFYSEYLVRRRNFRWWSKFNYILSSALDSGERFIVASSIQA
jgi:hypothetical protein